VYKSKLVYLRKDLLLWFWTFTFLLPLIFIFVILRFLLEIWILENWEGELISLLPCSCLSTLYFSSWNLGGGLKNFCFNLTLRSLVYFLHNFRIWDLNSNSVYCFYPSTSSAIYFPIFLLQLFLLDQGRIWDLDLFSSLFHSWDFQPSFKLLQLSISPFLF